MNYQFLHNVFLRSPLYSFERYEVKNIGDVLRCPYFRTALYLASPQLFHVLEKKGFQPGLLSEKEQQSVLKYYNRISYRPTPFGSFSSFALTVWGTGHPIELAPPDACKLHLRVDQQAVLQLTGPLTGNDASGHYQVNPTLYRLGGEFRFIRTSYPEAGGAFLFDLESYSYNALTKQIVTFCHELRKGSEIRSLIIQLTGCNPDTAGEHLDFLIDAQILVPRTGMNIIGQDYLERLTAVQGMMQVSFPGTGKLTALKERLSGAAHPTSSFYYAGLERPVISGNLNESHQRQILDGLHALNLLTPAAQPPCCRNLSPTLRKGTTAGKFRCSRPSIPKPVSVMAPLPRRRQRPNYSGR